MVYVFFGRTVRADAHYDEPLSEQLRRCHLLNTSKTLCVEFLQVIVRQTAFDYHLSRRLRTLVPRRLYSP